MDDRKRRKGERAIEPKNILVADGEEEIRIALADVLTRAGHNVVTASDGEEAFGVLEKGSVDLVICDAGTPKAGGMELLNRMKRKGSAIPFVLMAAHGSVEDAVAAMREGAADYLSKPFTSERLKGVMSRLFEDGASLNKGSVAQPSRGVSERRREARRVIVTENPAMKAALDIAARVAPSRSTVLIHGESGTGKELIARFIHEASDRREKPFVAVNCAALPETLLESELFGHEKGSFTGAVARKTGKFELADHGSILLDEVTEMAPQLQAKLLRVLQEGEIDRVGGREPIPLDIRVIATTNRDIVKAVEDGSFREDLYFRLNVIPLTLPPLRERREDIPLLVRHFIGKYNAMMGKSVTGIDGDALEALKNSAWRGNIREIENVMERAVLLAMDDNITMKDLMIGPQAQEAGRAGDAARPGVTVAEMEKKLIMRTLDEVGWNRTKAARMLGVSIRTLRNKLNEYKAKNGGK
ncbi:MAG: sigma-54-dependent transcriptional regulator [Candidatus Nitrospinota bacterium M3_3B_026]